MRRQPAAFLSAARLALVLALVLSAPVSAWAQTWGEVRVVESPVNVRQMRSPQAPVVRALKPGERVRVDFLRPSGWGAVFDLGATERDEAKAIGFADVRLLKPADAAAKPAPASAQAPASAAAPAPVPYRTVGQVPDSRQMVQTGQTSQASQPGQTSQVEARAEVFKERSLKSKVVAVLAPGERIQTAFPRDGFLAVFRLNEPALSEAAAVGFVPAGMVKQLPASAPTSAQAPPGAAAPAQPAQARTAEPKTAAAPAQPKTAEPRPAESRPAAAPAKAEGKSAPAPELKGEVKDGPALLGAQPALSGQAPVRITSDKMIYNQAENSVVFLGNVHGTHTDMAIWAARITAYFTDKKKGKDQKEKKDPQQEQGPGDFGDKIERIVAEGNVRLVANKNEGACAQLTYLVQEGVIRMDGNPILREGQNTVRGESIKFYIRENRSEVLSGTQRRVEAIFQSPKGEKK